jgi:hypothetical protein
MKLATQQQMQAAAMVQATDGPSMRGHAETSPVQHGSDAMDAAPSGSASGPAAAAPGTRSMATLSSSDGANSAPVEALTHVDASGRATMVDVAAKQPSMREARASAKVGTASLAVEKQHCCSETPLCASGLLDAHC